MELEHVSGTQAWVVTVTETGCDTSFGNQFTLKIMFANGTAVMDDVGHGKSEGTFASPNILHFPEGQSQIHRAARNSRGMIFSLPQIALPLPGSRAGPTPGLTVHVTGLPR